MRCSILRSVFLLLIQREIAAEDIGSRSVELQPRGLSCFDVLKEDLTNAKWRKEETKCYKHLLMHLDGVQNYTLGSTWFWDSIQLPTGVLYGSQYQLSNYDQCMNAPWSSTRPDLRTQYCLADVQLTNPNLMKAGAIFDPDDSAEVYLKTLSKYGRELNILTWGVCMPSSCGPQSVTKFLKVLLRHSALSGASSVNVTLDSCQVAGGKEQYSVGFYLFWIFLGSLSVAVIFSSFYAHYSDNSENKTDNYLTLDIVQAFCVQRNLKDLVKVLDDDIPCIYGMRAITAICAVVVHYILFSNSAALVNGLDLDKFIDQIWFFNNVSIAIDTFFLVSGLLTVKGLLAKKEKLENIFVVFWKRYVRLTVVLCVVVWYVVCVYAHASDGPLWARLGGREQRACARRGWLALLLLNNYIDTADLCYLVSWHTSADYQMTIVGVVLVYVFCGHRRLGTAIFAGLAVLAFLLPGLATYWYRLPATLQINVKSILNLPKSSIFASVYSRSHYRMGSYLVGMAAGYVLSVYKPHCYRNKIDMKWSMLIVTMALGTACAGFILGGLIFFREYSLLEAVVYASTNRIVWALAIGTIVLVCEYGTPTPASYLLSMHRWVPLSRLSYGVYLTHPAIIHHSVFSTRAPQTLLFYNNLMNGLGAAVLSFYISFMLWLLVQAPLVNLNNLLLHRKRIPKLLPTNGEHRGVHPSTQILESNGTCKLKSS